MLSANFSVTNHMFGAEVTQHVRDAYPDALLTAHFEVCAALLVGCPGLQRSCCRVRLSQQCGKHSMRQQTARTSQHGVRLIPAMHMFGAEVTQHVRDAYPDALLTAHFEVRAPSFGARKDMCMTACILHLTRPALTGHKRQALQLPACVEKAPSCMAIASLMLTKLLAES